MNDFVIQELIDSEEPLNLLGVNQVPLSYHDNPNGPRVCELHRFTLEEIDALCAVTQMAQKIKQQAKDHGYADHIVELTRDIQSALAIMLDTAPYRLLEGQTEVIKGNLP